MHLQTTVPPASIGCMGFTEDSLLRHAQFVVEQVESYDQYGDSDEDLLLVTPCMRSLIKLAGVTLGKRRAARKAARTDRDKKKVKKGSMVSQISAGEKGIYLFPPQATTTPLVRYIFEQFFSHQLAGKSSAPKRRRCGVCEVCQLPDCGTCNSCRDMVKFGGSGRSKQACVHRRCPNMAVQVAEEDEGLEEQETEQEKGGGGGKKARLQKKGKSKVEWVGEGRKEGRRRYYDAVLIDGCEVSLYALHYNMCYTWLLCVCVGDC